MSHPSGMVAGKSELLFPWRVPEIYDNRRSLPTNEIINYIGLGCTYNTGSIWFISSKEFTNQSGTSFSASLFLSLPTQIELKQTRNNEILDHLLSRRTKARLKYVRAENEKDA